MKIPFIFSMNNGQLIPQTSTQGEFEYIIKVLLLNPEQWHEKNFYKQIEHQRLLNQCLLNDYVIREINRLKNLAPIAYHSEFDKITFETSSRNIIFEKISSKFSDNEARSLGEVYNDYARLARDINSRGRWDHGYSHLLSTDSIKEHLPDTVTEMDIIEISSNLPTSISENHSAACFAILKALNPSIKMGTYESTRTKRTLKEINEQYSRTYHLNIFKECMPVLGTQIDKVIMKKIIPMPCRTNQRALHKI